MTNYTTSFDEIIHRPAKAVEKKNAVILMGGTLDSAIPVDNLAKEFSFNFNIYNKSSANLTLSSAKAYFEKSVATLLPEGIILHLGENDLNSFKKDSSAFDMSYLNLIEAVKACNKNCRIALVSLANNSEDKNLELMNAHIKAIADSEKVTFVSVENAKLWNPEATKAASSFAYDMGLKIRKPLRDVAEILYSWAYHNIESKTVETLVG